MNVPCAFLLVLTAFVAGAQPRPELVAEIRTNLVGLAANRAGQLFYTDGAGIYRIDGVNAFTQVAGGSTTRGEGGAPLETFLRPTVLAIDNDGNILFAETSRIRKIVNGAVVTIAGTGVTGYAGDGGPAVSARFRNILALASDTRGNLFVADFGNNRVRKIDPGSGIITTVAGDGTVDFANATGRPSGLAATADGAVYVLGDRRLRRIGPDNQLSVVAGSGGEGNGGDGGDARGAQLCAGTGSAATRDGIYVVSCQRIRYFDLQTGRMEAIGGDGVNFVTAGADLRTARMERPVLAASSDYLYFAIQNPGEVVKVFRIPAGEFAKNNPPEVTSVRHAATFLSYSQVVGGTIFSVMGGYLGSPEPRGLSLDASGSVTKETAGVRVLVNGRAAPLLYLSAGQINAISPFATPAASGNVVRVETPEGATDFSVFSDASPSPGIFPGAVLNEDGSVNTHEIPAQPGSIVVMYGTGLGPMNPTVADGAVPGGPIFPQAIRGIVPVINNRVQGTVLYAGQAPGFVAGVAQVNLRLPANLTGLASVSLGAVPTEVWVDTLGQPPNVASHEPVNLFAEDGAVTLHGANFDNNSRIELFLLGEKIATLSPLGPVSADGTTMQVSVNFGGAAGAYGLEVVNVGNRRSGRYSFMVSEVPSGPLIDVGGSQTTAATSLIDQTFTVRGNGFAVGASVDVFLDGIKLGTVAGHLESFLETFGELTFSFNLANRVGAMGVEVVNPGGTRSQRHVINIVRGGVPTILQMFPPQAAFPGVNRFYLRGELAPGASMEVYRGTQLVGTIPRSDVNVSPPYANVVYDFHGVGGAYDFVGVNPDGQRSAKFRFDVLPADVTPVLTSLQTNVLHAGKDLPLYVTGANLASGLRLDLLSSSGALIRSLVELGPNGGTSGPRISEIGVGYIIGSIDIESPGQYLIEALYPNGKRSNRLGFSISQ